MTGRISVIRETEAGQSVILRLIGPGEFFGWAGGWGEPVYSASAVAKESGVLLQLPAHEFSALITSTPSFALAVIQELGARLREAEARITDLQTAQVERRIAVVLLRLAQKSGTQTAAGIQLGARLTRRDVAQLAGTTLSTASRILSTWHHRGMIAGGREHIVILQPDALVRVLEEGPLHGSE